MNVVVFVVNYRADEQLTEFVRSVQRAQAAAEAVAVTLHVLDNSCRGEEYLASLKERLSRSGFPASVHSTGTNDGYFGPLSLSQSLVPSGADAVIYCNPDLVLEQDFFNELGSARKLGGVLAPSIVAVRDAFDQNPKYRHRLTRAKLVRLRAIYSTRLSFWTLITAGRVKELLASRGAVRRVLGVDSETEIYAPHGSLFVFPDVQFFLDLPRYPCFLFGEELFVAEEARLRGVRVVYTPRLRVQDTRHASVASLGRDRIRTYLLESVSWILQSYYGDADETA